MSHKVLVFESDAAFASELRSELSKLGCTTVVVDDGNTGLAQASKDPPHLILLSIELPRMNGFAVCNRIKKHPDLKDIPLVIVSSDSQRRIAWNDARANHAICTHLSRVNKFRTHARENLTRRAR